MIDNPLQEEYQKKINEKWREGDPDIFIDYYDNLKNGDNWENLNAVFEAVSKKNFGLTKVRVFDILWWLYLRAKELKDQRRELIFSSIIWWRYYLTAINLHLNN